MKTQLCLGLGWLVSLGCFAQTSRLPSLPTTPKHPVTDTYFGQRVIDDYRWLEDLKSAQTQDWFKAQGDYTNQLLRQIPGRDSLAQTYLEYDALQSATYADISQRAGRYFYRKTAAGQKVGNVYCREGKLGPESLLFDPEADGPGNLSSVTKFVPSPDGKLVAICVAAGGGEISTMRVLTVATRTFLSERMSATDSETEITWSPDSQGIIYRQLNSSDPTAPQLRLNTSIKYHQVGTAPTQDRTLLSNPAYPTLEILPKQSLSVRFTQDFHYLIAELRTASPLIRVLMAPAEDLGKTALHWQEIASLQDSVYHVASAGQQLFYQTVRQAPHGQVLGADQQTPSIKTAKLVLAESEKVLYEIHGTKDYLFVVQDEVVGSTVQQWHLATRQWQQIHQPVVGAVGWRVVNPATNECLLGISGWRSPFTRYEYDPGRNATHVSPFSSVAPFPGLSALRTEEVEIPSHDGTLVPLSILFRQGFNKDGRSVCLLTGYGAYGRSLVPEFNPHWLALLNQGVVIAVAHTRGGGEKGTGWYQAGFKTSKPNTWKDFIACGEWLIQQGYTSRQHLIGEGRSAGGILIGRALTERPDLFAAAINNVGVTNILRGEAMSSGAVNTPEFGTVKDSVESRALLEMDALYHVRDGVGYPAVICVGGMNDPRVLVWQPGKFAAALQNATRSGRPVLMQVNYDGGHSNENKAVLFRDVANQYAFALWQAGHPRFQPRHGQLKSSSKK